MMFRFTKAVLSFPSVTKGKVSLVLFITLVATFFEGFGVAMLFPIMDFIEKGKNFSVLAEKSKMWTVIAKSFDLFSIPKNLIALMAVVFCLLLVRQIFNYLKNTYSKWITECILSDIRTHGFRSFVSSDLSFHDQHDTGQMMNVLTVDGARAGAGIFSFFNLLAASTIFILYFVFLILLSPGMTLFAFLIMGCVGIVLKSRFAVSGNIGNEVSENNERISTAVMERLSGFRLLKLAGTEEKESNLIQRLSEVIRDGTYELGKIRAKMEFIVDPMVILAGLIILYFSIEVFHMTLAETGIFVFVLLRLMPFTKEVFHSRQNVDGLSGSVYRVKAFLEDAVKARLIRGGKITKLTLTRGIRFQNITFFYDPTKGDVLSHVSIFIPAGKMTALVGRSGAGKSTLVDLIPRLRVPSGGSLSIDDTPIENFDLTTLRRSIAFVSQVGFLFNDTIENNIKYCRPDASMGDVVRAAKIAHAEQFITQFPEGYQAVVGERGTKLSGGQRQRIILARAMLQQASIIILDEPTSALDSESERFIQMAMEKIRSESHVTMIIIAHRLSTIRSADQIVVLERGRILECGSHGQLMHEEAWYADMVKMQAVG